MNYSLKMSCKSPWWLKISVLTKKEKVAFLIWAKIGAKPLFFSFLVHPGGFFQANELCLVPCSLFGSHTQLYQVSFWILKKNLIFPNFQEPLPPANLSRRRFWKRRLLSLSLIRLRDFLSKTWKIVHRNGKGQLNYLHITENCANSNPLNGLIAFRNAFALLSLLSYCSFVSVDSLFQIPRLHKRERRW